MNARECNSKYHYILFLKGIKSTTHLKKLKTYQQVGDYTICLYKKHQHNSNQFHVQEVNIHPTSNGNKK